ncbi:MAG TPA: apolipoprotein N-acyltransferase [Burkholderiaceae bacterium]|nr:apolipoprotein N-acyltransferase [Burkholderiaceae bacterium]
MRARAVALALGAAHAASFAPLSLWWLQLAVLATFFGWSAARQRRSPDPWRAAVDAWWFGLAWFGVGICWLFISMYRYGGLPAPLAAFAVVVFAAGLAIFPALAHAAAFALAREKPGLALAVATAGTWTLAELARGYVFTGFPWLAIGYGQVDGPLAGLAPIAGVYAVGLGATLTAALAAASWPARSTAAPPQAPAARIAAALAALAVLVAAGAASALRFAEPYGEPLTVRLLQGNVPQHLKFEPNRALAAMQMYTELIEAAPAQLTILPETAWIVPWSGTPPRIAHRIEDYVRSNGAAVAIGMPLPVDSPEGTLANSVLVLTPATVADPRAAAPRYDKRHLVPFGEFIPLGFGWFVGLMDIPLGEFARGASDQPPIEVAGQRIGFNVCYEDLFGEKIAVAVGGARGATVLANVSNLAWFGDSHALPQHLQIARMRSLETQRPMLRATNTGVTAAIDADGTVIGRLPTATAGVLAVTVQGRSGLTPFVRFGNGPAAAAASIAVLLAALLGPAARILNSATRGS